MNGRRRFLRLTGAAAVPVALAAQTDSGTPNDITGAWSTVHTLPPAPGFPLSFRELLSFSSGGVVQETNSFLHSNSNLDFSLFGLPNVINASDGMGNWSRGSRGTYDIVFRKLLFNGQRQNFGDLKVTGSATVNGAILKVDWLIQVVDPTTGNVIAPLGPATSGGTRIAA
jgi:hypothetical protein